MRVVVLYTMVALAEYEPYSRAFFASYKKHPAGVDHELVVLLKGSAKETGALRRRHGVPRYAAVIPTGKLGWDLGAYMRVLPIFSDADRLVLLGAYSRILADDWLALLTAHGELAGATGSWEVRPHLRTTGLSVAPWLLADMPTSFREKDDCYAFEHGPDSLYRRALLAGVEGVVVGRDGRAYYEDDWRDSSTFRWGDQENLLIADNHTDTFARERAGIQRRLARAAWGRRGVSPAVPRPPAPITVLTVTIPGREELLVRTVESVNAQVVDVASHLIHSHPITDEPGMVQYTRAKNAMLPAVETEWVAVLNDDDVWLPHHVRTVSPLLSDPTIDVIYTFDAGRTRPRVDVNDWSAARLRRQIDEGNVIDGNALIRTSVLRDVGGFPTEWVGPGPREGGHYVGSPAVWEDQELWRRMLRLGARFRCVPEETWRYSVDTPDRIGGRT